MGPLAMSLSHEQWGQLCHDLCTRARSKKQCALVYGITERAVDAAIGRLLIPDHWSMAPRAPGVKAGSDFPHRRGSTPKEDKKFVKAVLKWEDAKGLNGECTVRKASRGPGRPPPRLANGALIISLFAVSHSGAFRTDGLSSGNEPRA